ncbi:MAG: thioredoxin family protein [Phycisphaerales bacterium]|nr:thioredoxin family protein [Phycisphaerales bacterium]
MSTTDHRVVSREQWLKERLELLAAEKSFTRQRDALAQKARELPWVRVEKDYAFDAPTGRKRLADLFGPRRQLVVYHFMFDPTWSQGCMGCSFMADHYDRLVVHLAHRDISLVTISRASVEQIEAFRRRMGWTFPWVSDPTAEFGRDFAVSFTDEEITGGNAVYNFNRKPGPIREQPGLSVFIRHDDGNIYNTYSTFARGLEEFITAYRFIDITPKGRDEDRDGGMNWVRHHDRYDDTNFIVPWAEKPGITAPLPR